MKRNFLNNLIYSGFNEIFYIAIPLITTPYVSRALGATAIGDYGFTNGIVNYFGIIAALGTINYGSREIAFNQKDKYNRSKVFFEILLLRLILSCISFLLYYAIILNGESQYQTLYLIQSILFLSWACDITWFFRGIEDFKVVSLRTITTRLLSALMIFIFVRTAEDLPIYAAIMTIGNLVGSAVAWISIKENVCQIDIKELQPFRHLRGSLSFFVSTAAIQIYTVLDQTMLGTLVNTTEVGYYSQAQKIIRLCLVIISSFVLVLVPRIASLYRDNNKNGMNRYYSLSLDYLFLFALPMMSGCIICSDHFVLVFFGPGYEPTRILLKLLSSLFLILGMGQLIGSVLSAINKQKQVTFATIIGAFTNFALNMILIRGFASIGAVIASIVAELVVTSIDLVLIKKYFSLKCISNSFLNYLIPTLIMSGVILLVRMAPINNVFILLSAEVLSGVVSYFIALFIKKDHMIQYVLNTIKHHKQ